MRADLGPRARPDPAAAAQVLRVRARARNPRALRSYRRMLISRPCSGLAWRAPTTPCAGLGRLRSFAASRPNLLPSCLLFPPNSLRPRGTHSAASARRRLPVFARQCGPGNMPSLPATLGRFAPASARSGRRCVENSDHGASGRNHRGAPIEGTDMLIILCGGGAIACD